MISDAAPLPKGTVVCLLLLAGLHFALAAAYAALTPYRAAGVLFSQRDPATGQPIAVPDIGAPDERQHANYVAHLLAGKGFPTLVWEIPDPADPSRTIRNPELAETYQSHQPPLYYLAAAGFARLAGADPLAPSGARVRWLNGLFGAATVAGVFFLALWGLGRADVGLGAAAFAALLPMQAALSGAISNDPLLFALCTWCLAVCARGVRRGFSWRLALLAGLLAGLALLTKTTAVALIPVLLVGPFLARDREGAALKGAAGLLVALAIAAPWWLRNQSLYGDPLAMRAFNEAFVGSPQAEAFIQHPQVGPVRYLFDFVGWWTLRSFFGAFGYMDVFLEPEALYWVLTAICAAGALGLAPALRKREEEPARGAHLLNGLFLGVVLLMFLRFNLQYFQGQARYVLPAIGPIAAGLARGWTALARERGALVAGLAAAALLGLNLYALGRLPQEFAERTANQLARSEHP